MTFEYDKDGDRRRKADHTPDRDDSESSPKKKKRASAPELGNALRSVYQKAVNEEIPPEMLDLLGKLG